MKATEKRPIGKTGLTVTALGVGTAPLGGLYAAVSKDDATAMLDRAWEAGIRYFDTAPMYGNGRSEHLAGALLREKNPEQRDWTVSTKVGRLMTTERAGRKLPPAPPKNPLDPGWWNALDFREVFDYSYDGIMRSFDDSQQRLGFPNPDILYVHDIGSVTHADLHDHHWSALTKGGGFRALTELRDAGDIKGFGLGVNEWQIIRDALEEADLDCSMLAGRYTLLDQDAEQQFLPLAHKRGMALVVAGVFNSGILASTTGRRKFNYADAPQDMIDKAERLRAVCDSFAVPLPAAAIQFPLRHPAATCVVIGAKTAEQISTNIGWFEQDIPEDLWAQLRAEGLINS
ncbi:aldo/keto reductase [Agrobacterium vitis]|uniref:aldo/keto reductase n=1 Tax=Agrobacterium vitis TaxID=373 RepID=UPI0015719611|nr:aldo/keto reductase [Agrobacterium vitis]NSZ19278.1 aldo/keto reductase [Agrobacterium vitis]QZO06149.1 aldo/keto reductase [Agrobacterium vitis]UJL90472.1 aldo/keto reductase [Agrobacterium vitis]